MFKITTEWLKQNSACKAGCDSFKDRFGGEADIQEVVDYFYKIDQKDWILWLFNSLPLGEDITFKDDIERDVVFSLGSIDASGSIKAGIILAKKSIKAGGIIQAGGIIKAGGSIKARLWIKAGE